MAVVWAGAGAATPSEVIFNQKLMQERSEAKGLKDPFFIASSSIVTREFPAFNPLDVRIFLRALTRSSEAALIEGI